MISLTSGNLEGPKFVSLDLAVKYVPPVQNKLFRMYMYTNDSDNDSKGERKLLALNLKTRHTDATDSKENLQITIQWFTDSDGRLPQSAAILLCAVVMLPNGEGSRGWQRFANARFDLSVLLNSNGQTITNKMMCYTPDERSVDRGRVSVSVSNVKFSKGMMSGPSMWRSDKWEITNNTSEDTLTWASDMVERSAAMFDLDKCKPLHPFLERLHSFYFHLGLHPFMGGALNTLYEPTQLPSQEFYATACAYVCERWRITPEQFVKYASEPKNEQEYLIAQQVTAETILLFVVMTAYNEDLLLQNDGRQESTDGWFAITLSITGDCEDKARLIVILADQLCRLNPTLPAVIELKRICSRFVPCHLLCAARAGKVSGDQGVESVNDLNEDSFSGHYTSIFMPCWVFVDRWKQAANTRKGTTPHSDDTLLYLDQLTKYAAEHKGPYLERTLVLEGTGYSQTLHKGDRVALQQVSDNGQMPEDVRRRIVLRTAMRAMRYDNEMVTARYDETENGMFFDGFSMSVFTNFFNRNFSSVLGSKASSVPLEFAFFTTDKASGTRYGAATFDLFSHKFENVSMWPTYMLTHEDVARGKRLLLEEPPYPTVDGEPNQWHVIMRNLLPDNLTDGTPTPTFEDFYVSADILQQNPNLIKSMMTQFRAQKIASGYDIQPQPLGKFGRIRIRLFLPGASEVLLKNPFITRASIANTGRKATTQTKTSIVVAAKDALRSFSDYTAWLTRLHKTIDVIKFPHWEINFRSLLDERKLFRASLSSSTKMKDILAFDSRRLPVSGLSFSPDLWFSMVSHVLFDFRFLGLSSHEFEVKTINKEKRICAVNWLLGYPSIEMRVKFKQVWNTVFGRHACVYQFNFRDGQMTLMGGDCIVGNLGMEPVLFVDKKFVSLLTLEEKSLEMNPEQAWQWMVSSYNITTASENKRNNSVYWCDSTMLENAQELNTHKPGVLEWLRKQLFSRKETKPLDVSAHKVLFDRIERVNVSGLETFGRWRRWPVIDFRAHIQATWQKILKNVPNKLYSFEDVGSAHRGGVCIYTNPHDLTVPLQICAKLQVMWEHLYPGCTNIANGSGTLTRELISGNLGARTRIFVGDDEVQFPRAIITSKTQLAHFLELYQKLDTETKVAQSQNTENSGCNLISPVFSEVRQNQDHASDLCKNVRGFVSSIVPVKRFEKQQTREMIEHVLFERMNLKRSDVHISGDQHALVIHSNPANIIPEDVRQLIGHHLLAVASVHDATELFTHDYDLNSHTYRTPVVTGSLISGLPWQLHQSGSNVMSATLKGSHYAVQYVTGPRTVGKKDKGIDNDGSGGEEKDEQGWTKKRKVVVVDDDESKSKSNVKGRVKTTPKNKPPRKPRISKYAEPEGAQDLVLMDDWDSDFMGGGEKKNSLPAKQAADAGATDAIEAKEEERETEDERLALTQPPATLASEVEDVLDDDVAMFSPPPPALEPINRIFDSGKDEKNEHQSDQYLMESHLVSPTEFDTSRPDKQDIEEEAARKAAEEDQFNLPDEAILLPDVQTQLSNALTIRAHTEQKQKQKQKPKSPPKPKATAIAEQLKEKPKPVVVAVIEEKPKEKPVLKKEPDYVLVMDESEDKEHDTNALLVHGLAAAEKHISSDVTSRVARIIQTNQLLHLKVEGPEDRDPKSEDSARLLKATTTLITNVEKDIPELIELTGMHESLFAFHLMLRLVIAPALRMAVRRLHFECSQKRQIVEAIIHGCERIEHLTDLFNRLDRLHLMEVQDRVYRAFGAFGPQHLPTGSNPLYSMRVDQLVDSIRSLRKRLVPANTEEAISAEMLRDDLLEIESLHALVRGSTPETMHIYTTWLAGPIPTGIISRVYDFLVSRGSVPSSLADIQTVLPDCYADFFSNPSHFAPQLLLIQPEDFRSRLRKVNLPSDENDWLLTRVTVPSVAKMMEFIHSGLRISPQQVKTTVENLSATFIQVGLASSINNNFMAVMADHQFCRSMARTSFARTQAAFVNAIFKIGSMTELKASSSILLDASYVAEDTRELRSLLRHCHRPYDSKNGGTPFESPSDTIQMVNALRMLLAHELDVLNLFLADRIYSFVTTRSTGDFFPKSPSRKTELPQQRPIGKLMSACRIAELRLSRINHLVQQIRAWDKAKSTPQAFTIAYKRKRSILDADDDKKIKFAEEAKTNRISYGLLSYALHNVVMGHLEIVQLLDAVEYWRDTFDAMRTVFLTKASTVLSRLTNYETWKTDLLVCFSPPPGKESIEEILFEEARNKLVTAVTGFANGFWTSLLKRERVYTLSRLPSLGFGWYKFWQRGGSSDLRSACVLPDSMKKKYPGQFSLAGAMCLYVFDTIFGFKNVKVVETMREEKGSLLPNTISLSFDNEFNKGDNFSTGAMRWLQVALDRMFPGARFYKLRWQQESARAMPEYLMAMQKSVQLFTQIDLEEEHKAGRLDLVPAWYAEADEDFALKMYLENLEAQNDPEQLTPKKISSVQFSEHYDVASHINPSIMLHAVANLGHLALQGYSHPLIDHLGTIANRRLKLNGAFTD